MKQLTIFIMTLVALLSGATAAPVLAQEQTPAPCQTLPDGKEYRLTRTYLLAEAQPERASGTLTPGDDGTRLIQQSETLVMLEAGEQVLLSGSPDGAGFRADDWIRLDVEPAGTSWAWDFRSADRMRIVPLESTWEITEFFRPGENQVTLTIRDLLGPVYSHSALWLLILDPCASSSASETQKSAVVSAPPAHRATAEATPLPTAIALAQPETARTQITTTGQLVQSAPAAGERAIEGLSDVNMLPAPVNQAFVTVQPVQRSFPWRFSIGLLLLGLAIWQGRRMTPEQWQATRQQLQRRWQAFKERLEAMQQE